VCATLIIYIETRFSNIFYSIMEEVKQYLTEAEENMELAVMHLEEVLGRIRAGKANVHILDGIRVDYYGAKQPLANVSNVSIPDARSIVIRPFDKSMLKVIEKAIIDSPLGIMPENNGEVIRLGIPVLTEERRKELAKQCSKEVEQSKVSIRNARRDCIDKLKKSTKNGVSEDNERDAEDAIQKTHDKFIKKVDSLLEAKNKEIMTV